MSENQSGDFNTLWLSGPKELLGRLVVRLTFWPLCRKVGVTHLQMSQLTSGPLANTQGQGDWKVLQPG
jgi:hypothetical protein